MNFGDFDLGIANPFDAAPPAPAPSYDAPAAAPAGGGFFAGLAARGEQAAGAFSELFGGFSAGDVVSATTPPVVLDDPYAKAAARVGANYVDAPPEHLPEEKVGKMDTPEARMAVIDKMTQNDGTNDGGEYMCGSTSIVAAAVASGGVDGIKTLMNQMDLGRPKGAKDSMDVAELKKKLATNGELSVGDMQALQGTLYRHLKDKEKKNTDMSEDARNQVGLDGATLQSFMSSSPEMKKMFTDNNYSINRIDNDGDGKANHFVLAMNNKDGLLQQVYDPYSRKGEHQVVTDKDQVHDYDLARSSGGERITPK